MNAITTSIIDQLSVKNENGEVVSFDLAQLDAIITELRGIAKDVRVKNKDAEKDKADADKAILAERAKAYYDSLAVGDSVSYVDASGKEWEGVKIETKSKSGMTAALELVNPPAGAKNTKRYPKFHQVVVPADFAVPSAENAAAVA